MKNHKPTRRDMLTLIGLAGVSASVGCGSDDSPAGSTSTPDTTTSTTTSSSGCAVAPNETLGPYPSITDVVRSDIRQGSTGLPLNLTIVVVNASNACSPVAGAVVDVWQCDSQGRYSQYNQPGYDGRSDNFLRGTQTTDAAGRVGFITVYPGWYAGRATHIHVEVSLNGRSVKVTQIAFPEEVTAAVYASGVYASKGQNPTRNSGDMVFADGFTTQLATLSGSTSGGYSATWQLGVAV